MRARTEKRRFSEKKGGCYAGKLISAGKPKRVKFNGFLITLMYIHAITSLEEHSLCVMGFDMIYRRHSFFVRSGNTFLTVPELTCCVSNQKMFHFI